MGMFVEGEKSLHPVDVASFCFDGEVFSSDELFGFFENLLCVLHVSCAPSLGFVFGWSLVLSL
jgi:hypothetical protein